MSPAKRDGMVDDVNRRLRSAAIRVAVGTLLCAALPADLVAALPLDPTSAGIASDFVGDGVGVRSIDPRSRATPSATPSANPSEPTSGLAGGTGPASSATVLLPVAGAAGTLAAMAMVLLSAALALAGFTRLAFRGVVRTREP